MSAVDVAPAAPMQIRVTQAGVLRSEWTKFRSLRSTVWTLLVSVILMVGIGALISAVTASSYGSMSVADKAQLDPISISLSGITFAQLAIGVLGVLLISGEYSTGMIRASLTVVPRRLPVLWGKIVVFATTVFSVSLIASVVSFYVGQALLHSKGLDVAITTPGGIRSVVGAALYLTVAGLIGIAIGALMRNTAAGISTFVGLFFVIPPLTNLLPTSIQNHLTQYLPSRAGSAIYGGGFDTAHMLSPWTGFGLVCVYAVILIGAAAWRMRRTDA